MEMENEIMQGRDIVMVGLQPWDVPIGSNCKNIAMELSRYNRVLYVNRALDRISSIRDKNDPITIARMKSIRREVDDINEVHPNLFVLNPRTIVSSANWVPTDMLFDYFNYRNNKSIAKEIQQAMKRLQFVDPILINDSDFFRAFYMDELLPGFAATVYYIRDNLVSQPYFQKHGVRLEPKLMAKSTMVAANSAYLANYAKQHNPNSIDIGQGCEFDHFIVKRAPEKPFGMQGINGPLIGYVGALMSARLDINIIKTIAQANTQWQVILVGPEDESFRQSELHNMPNVHFLGPQPAHTLADYIYHFDVCMNPQALNDMTIGNYPRKVDEYLAMGKPVVATKTAAMEMFAPYTYLCENANEYVQAIGNILRMPVDLPVIEARKKFALSHTWPASVGKMCQQLKQILEQQNKRTWPTIGLATIES
ncbi:glycosyltransferase involved in cell wall biosynthesis [Chitinophaga skermanii]|uniref:Glycosyltransferase involved in cell wall biosynthesis n=1 Tax=Chitinophaga skermanii TaxID=331697 RepID=A0A327QQU6_9BACT|nr:glycosyltransferase [Chitinophaga skermanii]RAJ06939.1 glycosyltransferase involved in cell wall biosynthesis [Chitinophaga skermanii]